ncbi:hypothetical protein E2C01_040753 [Portunus trituberculatus]|uniref:Uncharacterized protein n=1 Tax=Portunus trituberculatus TaxID=210409 RepID=A0A5B7FNT5_PORTR|nr:hypothetical protein [Portunus trituberculatus]
MVLPMVLLWLGTQRRRWWRLPLGVVWCVPPSGQASTHTGEGDSGKREWRIRTNIAKFTVIPLATKNPAQLLVDGDDVGFSPRGSLLGLSVSSMGYTSHVTQRVVRVKSALTRLFCFRDLATGLKLQLIKALVLPILYYPPVPLHALSKTVISRLQKVQNSALRFAFGTRWDDFTSSASLHEAASLPALNVRLHDLAAKLWQRMEDEGWDQYPALKALHEDTPHQQHRFFPQQTTTTGLPDHLHPGLRMLMERASLSPTESRGPR